MNLLPQAFYELGYSALTIAQQLPRGGRLVSFEKEWTWWLAARRFMWQASQGQEQAAAADRVGNKAAEASLEVGAVVVADNAGVFAQGGMRDYLEYVRNSPRYSSRYLESTLEWRDDVADGLEL
ncbi:uncharacterized protein HaLaN_06312 [Haematococcus lacustris]|uniref:Uncharacterized protein n=1 Tax=Haematococcus lacustris TaxID=44745 RepID=A0A699YT38_HAELA|nr:uncharacterized protein HaLaN_06312 [Haematococcus lacustris]